VLAALNIRVHRTAPCEVAAILLIDLGHRSRAGTTARQPATTND
jgi:hypothetical protein